MKTNVEKLRETWTNSLNPADLMIDLTLGAIAKDVDIDRIINLLKDSKLSSSRLEGRWCYWFKEEFESYPEAELLLRTVLNKEIKQLLDGEGK